MTELVSSFAITNIDETTPEGRYLLDETYRLASDTAAGKKISQAEIDMLALIALALATIEPIDPNYAPAL